MAPYIETGPLMEWNGVSRGGMASHRAYAFSGVAWPLCERPCVCVRAFDFCREAKLPKQCKAMQWSQHLAKKENFTVKKRLCIIRVGGLTLVSKGSNSNECGLKFVKDAEIQIKMHFLTKNSDRTELWKQN